MRNFPRNDEIASTDEMAPLFWRGGYHFRWRSLVCYPLFFKEELAVQRAARRSSGGTTPDIRFAGVSGGAQLRRRKMSEARDA